VLSLVIGALGVAGAVALVFQDLALRDGYVEKPGLAQLV
jgi:hypothetical protein